jgi:hypothetical protein
MRQPLGQRFGSRSTTGGRSRSSAVTPRMPSICIASLATAVGWRTCTTAGLVSCNPEPNGGREVGVRLILLPTSTGRQSSSATLRRAHTPATVIEVSGGGGSDLEPSRECGNWRCWERCPGASKHAGHAKPREPWPWPVASRGERLRVLARCAIVANRLLDRSNRSAHKCLGKAAHTLGPSRRHACSRRPLTQPPRIPLPRPHQRSR